MTTRPLTVYDLAIENLLRRRKALDDEHRVKVLPITRQLNSLRSQRARALKLNDQQKVVNPGDVVEWVEAPGTALGKMPFIYRGGMVERTVMPVVSTQLTPEAQPTVALAHNSTTGLDIEVPEPEWTAQQLADEEAYYAESRGTTTDASEERDPQFEYDCDGNPIMPVDMMDDFLDIFAEDEPNNPDE